MFSAICFYHSVLLMMTHNWCLLVLLLFYPDYSLQESKTVENTAIPVPRALSDAEMFIRVVDVVLNSNLCIDVHFHKDSRERRLEMRVTSSLVRCSLLAPFCSFLMDVHGSVYMGCLEANETTSRLYRHFMEGNQIRTERGVGGICENAVCQLEEAIRQNIPDIYQLFRWKLLDWVEEQSKLDKPDEKSNVDEKDNGLSGTVRLSILIAVAVAVLAVAGAILGFVGYNTKQSDKKKNKKAKKKIYELQEHDEVCLQEKTESQAKMTQL